MGPSKRQSGRAGGKKKSSARTALPGVPTYPEPNDPYDVKYFKRHVDDDPNEAVPGREFLEKCPPSVRGKFYATLAQVAKAPPPRFSGGGLWEPMKGKMKGYYEMRFDGPPRRTHYRLFCRLDAKAEGYDRPLLVIIDGESKAFRTKLSERRYQKVRDLGDEYLARNPRSLLAD